MKGFVTMTRVSSIITGFTCLVLGTVQASAQTWPIKPIRTIVPFAAGSFTDVLPRVVLDQIATQIRQPIIVENRGGAGGTIGTGTVAKADPDGYTLLATSSAHTIAPAIYPNLSYDTARDLAGVASLGLSPLVMIIAPSKGIRTVQDFVTAAKAKPGTINFASAGVGSATHLSAERFIASAGFQATHIPYKGGPEALTDVIAGRADFYFCPLGTALPQVRSGTVLALAVSTPQRAASLPDVPSTLEAGFVDSDYSFWVGVFAPVKTPREIVDRLHAETQQALQAANVKARLSELGVDPMPMSPSEFDTLVKKEIVTSATLAKAAGLKPN
jgi:tripartite-type tricarboxylate transporter receptor subunit TctC